MTGRDRLAAARVLVTRALEALEDGDLHLVFAALAEAELLLDAASRRLGRAA